MRLTALVLVVLLTPSLAHAEDMSSWVGQRVVTKLRTPLQDGSRIVDDGSVFRVYTVERADGDRLWLVAGSVAGWVRPSEVVPHDQATDYFTQEIRANPRSAYPYFRRGLIWAGNGDANKALADFNEAIRLDPNSAVSYDNRGIAWFAMKDYDKAKASYDEAIRLDPTVAVAFYNRGICWFAKQDNDKALADFSEAIRLDPKLAWAYGNRGTAWFFKKDYDKALADYDEVIRLDPKGAVAFYNRGDAWKAKRNFDQAIADYGEAIRLDPKLAMAFNNRANSWKAKRGYDQAIADYNEAIRLDPKDATRFVNLAWLLATCPVAKHRDGKKAVQLAIRGCELSVWENPNHLGILAAAYAEAGDFDKAVEWQEKANKLYAAPENRRKGEERLMLYRERKPYRQTD